MKRLCFSMVSVGLGLILCRSLYADKNPPDPISGLACMAMLSPVQCGSTGTTACQWDARHGIGCTGGCLFCNTSVAMQNSMCIVSDVPNVSCPPNGSTVDCGDASRWAGTCTVPPPPGSTCGCNNSRPNSETCTTPYQVCNGGT